MAFGTLSKSSRKSRKGKSREKPEADEELLSWSEKNPGQLQGIVVLGSMIVTVCMLFASAPHTYAAKRVHYNNAQIAYGALSGGLLPEYKEKAEVRYGIDFRRILTPAFEEKTKAMQQVARSCLPKREHENFTIAGPGGDAYKMYGNATDYLICVMSTELARLCESGERDRLVEQLHQYRERRQNLLGLDQYHEWFAEKVASSKLAQYQSEQFQTITEANTDVTPAPKAAWRIGTDLDRRLVAALSNLIVNGYLSPSDFGWMGLYLPEEYADALSVGRRAKACM